MNGNSAPSNQVPNASPLPQSIVSSQSSSQEKKIKKSFSLKTLILTVIIFLILGLAAVFVLLESHKKAQTQELSSIEVQQKNQSSSLLTKQSQSQPRGYSWRECDGLIIKFLIPDGWFFKEESNQDTKACFVTKQSIDTNGYYITGLTANAVPNILQKTAFKPTDYAQQFLQKISLKYKTGDMKQTIDKPNIKGFTRTVYSEASYGPITQQFLVVGNDNTDTVYIIWFEGPTSSWDSDWSFGKVIMDNISLNH